MSPAALGADERRMIALDVDGTVLQESGAISDRVIAEVQRVAAAGHEVLLATGRSASTTLPVLERLGIVPEFVVCANGAVVLRRDDEAPVGYVREHVETFDPSQVLTTIRDALGDASYAVEDADGAYRYDGAFPDGALGAASVATPFEELLRVEATRVVVISPEHELEDFLAVVDSMGLHKVSYNIGWTAWLDIAPDGVNKGTALDLVQERLGVRDDRVIVMGDGRNDIDMFRWASSGGGVAVAMGQAPPEVVEAATESTATDLDDGVARALRRLVP